MEVNLAHNVLYKRRMHGLVYRLRKKGFGINSKQRIMFLDKPIDELVRDKIIKKRTATQIERLRKEFGFEIQLEIPDAKEEPKSFIDWGAIK